MSSRPDPAAAHSLIIGTCAYADEKYPRMPAAAASAAKMHELLSEGRIWDMHPENVLYLPDATVREAAEAIDAKTSIADLSALLIYICGHGQIWTEDDVPDTKVHFALTDSRQKWEFTHLPFRNVRRMLQRPTQAHRMLIVDSCYTKGAYLGGSEREPPHKPGVCTMVATKEWLSADATWEGTGYTAFSGAFIEILQQGIKGPEEFLRPESVFTELCLRLDEARKPEPGMQFNGTQMILGRNPGYDVAADRPPSAQLLEALYQHRGTGPISVDPAAYAHAVAECRAARHGERAAELIEKYSAVGLVKEVADLVGHLRSADLPEDADHVVTAFSRCRLAAEIAEFVHRVHWQADLSIDGLLKVLAQQPASAVIGLIDGLRDQACDECAATRERIGDRILRVWPPERHNELLLAWPRP